MEQPTQEKAQPQPMLPINRLKHFSVAPSPAPDTQAIRFVIEYNEFIISAANLFYEQVVKRRCIIEDNVNAELVNKEMQGTPEGQSVCSAQLITLEKIIHFFNEVLPFSPVYDVKYESDAFDITMIYPDCEGVVGTKKADKGKLSIVPRNHRDVTLSVLNTIRDNGEKWEKCTNVSDDEILDRWHAYKNMGAEGKPVAPLTVDAVSNNDLRSFGRMVSETVSNTRNIGLFFGTHTIKGAPGNLVGKFMSESTSGYLYVVEFDLANEVAYQEPLVPALVEKVGVRVEKFIKTELAKCKFVDTVNAIAANGRIHVALRFRVNPTMTPLQIGQAVVGVFEKVSESSGSKCKQWRSALKG